MNSLRVLTVTDLHQSRGLYSQLREAVRRHFGGAAGAANVQALSAGAALLAQPHALAGATA